VLALVAGTRNQRYLYRPDNHMLTIRFDAATTSYNALFSNRRLGAGPIDMSVGIRFRLWLRSVSPDPKIAAQTS